MFRPSALTILFAALLAIVGLSGCDSGANKGKMADKGKGHDHHDHDHEAHGPNDGHILELGEDEYHAEWLYDSESGNVKVIILDGEMKKEVPIAASDLTIETKVAGKENTYKLAASNPSPGEKPMSSRFEIEDKTLVTALKAAGKGDIKAKLTVDINGKTFSAEMKHHDHKH